MKELAQQYEDQIEAISRRLAELRDMQRDPQIPFEEKAKIADRIYLLRRERAEMRDSLASMHLYLERRGEAVG